MAAKLPTKSEILASIAETTELSRKQVASVFEALSGLIKKNVGKKGPGMFVVPGLMKIVVISYHGRGGPPTENPDDSGRPPV